MRQFTSTVTRRSQPLDQPKYPDLEQMATNVDPAPQSTLPYPPIHKDKKFVVLSDWSVRIIC